MSVLHDMFDAFGLLTVVPMPVRAADRDRGGVAGWFPFVGLVLGGAVVGLLAVVNSVSFVWGDGGFIVRAAPVISALVVGAWALVTRFLHWDGLADVGDGFWGGHDQDRRLEIMADSHTGAFGVTAVVLVALLQVAAVSVILQRPTGVGLALLGAPVFGRLAATFAAWLGEPAREGGLGRSVVGTPTLAGGVVAATSVAIAVSVAVWQWGMLSLMWAGACIVAALVVPHVISERFGGVTGDVMGASVLVTEGIALVLAALLGSW